MSSFYIFVDINRQMKLFACILSIYIVALTAIPCIDRPEDSHLQKSEIGGNAANSHQHTEGDQCSPFCTCNCCATPVIYQDFSVQFDGFSFIEQSISVEYTSAIFSCHLSSIWQPPQIA